MPLVSSLPLSFFLSQPLSRSQSLLYPPLPTHYSVPLYCSYSTWLEYSLARPASCLEPTGPCPLICLISSVRPLEVCVCLSAFLSVSLSMHYKLLCMSVTPHECVSECECVCWLLHVHSLGELWLAAWQAKARHIVNQRPALLHSALPPVYVCSRGQADRQAPTLDHINTGTGTNTLTSLASFICL